MPLLSANERHKVSFRINGLPVRVEVEPRTLASDAIRHQLGLTGTHVGCEHGVCGACTILIDDAPARACLTLAVQLEDRSVRTIESLGQNGALNVLQTAFARNHALQCGFCTAGILMSASDLLARDADPDERAIRDCLSGHLCRCTGYTAIVAAIREAAATIREASRHV